jgi:hypothetical protein
LATTVLGGGVTSAVEGFDSFADYVLPVERDFIIVIRAA